MSLVDYYVTGDFPCAIVNAAFTKVLCGYVGVPPAHPWYGRPADEIPVSLRVPLSYASHEEIGHPTDMTRLEELLQAAHDAGMPDDDVKESITTTQAHAGERYPCDTGQDVWWVGFASWDSWGGDVFVADEQSIRRELDKLLSQAAAAARNPPPPPMTAAEFKEARLRLGCTQVELADKLGLCSQTISNYECGRHTIPLAIEQLVRVLISRRKRNDERRYRRATRRSQA